MLLITPTPAPLTHAEQSLLARRMLRAALRDNYGIAELPPFDIGPGGKPSLHGCPGIHFNISHCLRAVAVAVADEPIGVDIESLRAYRPAVARRVMGPEAIAAIEAAPDQSAAFTEQWTRAEALAKLHGRSIFDARSLDPAAAEFHTIINSECGYVCTTANFSA